jgi:hypothetical protein
VPHYSLVTLDGVSLGLVELEREDWRPGNLIHTAPTDPNLRVVDVLEAEDAEGFTVLVVEET